MMTENEAQAVESEYSFPLMSLLKRNPSVKSLNISDHFREISLRLQDALCSADIDAHIINVYAGPMSIRYEIELGRGVRLAEIEYCASDIALALGCEKVSVAPVAGKCSVVAIDVPKRYAETVYLHEVMNSREFMTKRPSLAFALGKDILGNDIICDLNKERHLMIGGTTGSGKSTLLHSLVIGLLYHASPDDVRFVMVDTNGLEFAPYNGIPQMLIPVVTDERKATGALQWLNMELQRRYKMISDSGATSLDSFNHLAAEKGGETIPHIVAVIDDIFHLLSPKDDSIEDVLRNLILRGHVVGIHLVMATQYAYSGAVVKLANLRNMGRIAFALPGRYDSIALIGREGAEKLSGKGEMLYLPVGSSTLQHIQGCFVSGSEIEAVTSYIKAKHKFNFDAQVLVNHEKSVPNTVASVIPRMNTEKPDRDEQFYAAVDVVLETGQASVSMLQRRLKIGYTQAARIVDAMEEKGIVGSFQGARPRDLLITREQWEKMKNK